MQPKYSPDLPVCRETRPGKRRIVSLSNLKSLTEYVALDVETTGLNPQSDDVIEVAVIVFNEREEVSRYSQLVRPRRSLSLHISRLTGIDQEMLEKSPRFEDIVDDLSEAIGDRPIIGHNISFDMSMLAGEGFKPDNRLIDTYTLATGLLHDVANFQLGTLAEYLGHKITDDDRHRALGDATATMHVFQKLLERLGDYDSTSLRQIGQFAKAAKWREAWFFDDLARAKADAPLFDPGKPNTVPLDLAFMAPRERPEPLRPTGNQEGIDTATVEHLLKEDGPLKGVLAGFQPRPTQITMARRVAEALNDDQNLLIEAGTGTGKSLAYLLPAALFAVQRGERVVVSTATIALQDQLHHKDLPDVHVALIEAGVADELNVAVMKGRQNYLCLKQWFAHKDDPIEDEADASLRAKILLWLGHTETGDKGELRLLAVLAFGAGLAFAFAAIADEVLEGETQDFDLAVLQALRGADGGPIGPGWLREAMRDLTALGSFSVLGLVVVAVLGYLLLTGKRVMALLVLVSVIGGTLVSSVLKQLFGRPRPDLEAAAEVFTASFPSGHALISAVTYLTLGALLARVQRSARLRVYIIGVAVLLTLVIGLSRLHLGLHYPTDVLAGWCLGAAWACLCLAVAAWLQRRGTAEPPGEDPAAGRLR